MRDRAEHTVLVTGANSGIGFAATSALVEAGAEVVMACRDRSRAEAAARSLPAGPGGAVVADLDLADLSGVSSFAEALTGPVDDLVLNAAIMACPLRFSTDGIELQMATNHFGHVLLTSLLLRSMPGDGRVVVVTSIAARGGRLGVAMRREDLVAPSPYRPQVVYSNTKQANLLFALELNRRLLVSGRGIRAIAVHPGVSATELFSRQLRDQGRGALVPLVRPLLRVVLQSPAAGAAPVLRALSDGALEGGELIGPRHLGQSRGRPEILPVFTTGRDENTARRLVELTENVISGPILP